MNAYAVLVLALRAALSEILRTQKERIQREIKVSAGPELTDVESYILHKDGVIEEPTKSGRSIRQLHYCRDLDLAC